MTIPAKKGGGVGSGAAVVDPESLKCKFIFVNDNVVTGKSSLRQKTRKHVSERQSEKIILQHQKPFVKHHA